MKYVRWYDKDPDLSRLMKFLENINEEIRDEIAQDLIQILMGEVCNNSDEKISDLSALTITEYKRWYDQNLSLHSAVELIKNFGEEERREIITRLMESVVQILTEHSYEQRP